MKGVDVVIYMVLGAVIMFGILPVIIFSGSTRFVDGHNVNGIPQKYNGGYVIVSNISERVYLEYQKSINMKRFDERLSELGE